ncbi:MAG: FkbM family methyltransferase [Acidobacteria bacterium]|nr:FkbM family methyltransferase [Acidobacteriota bacterium]MBS1866163.1 FkbM family methyltransferase [Acidobacteriota bacterium]
MNLKHMNQRLRYELRGWAYWAECANPFRETVTARNLPLGLRMEGYKRDAVGRGLYRRGVHEPGPTKFVLETFLNAKGKSFLDVGGNIGYFSCLFGTLAGPQGKVIAIEPEPGNRRLLERNVRNNGLTNVTVLPYAVGAATATAKMGLYKAANRGRHSLVDLEPCKNFIEVPVRRLDDLLQGSSVDSWAAMKLDAEGYEPYIFEGAQQTLARTDLLLMEYAPTYWKKAGFEPASIFQRLLAHFPKMYRFEGTDLVPTTAEACSGTDQTCDLVLRK